MKKELLEGEKWSPASTAVERVLNFITEFKEEVIRRFKIKTANRDTERWAYWRETRHYLCDSYTGATYIWNDNDGTITQVNPVNLESKEEK